MKKTASLVVIMFTLSIATFAQNEKGDKGKNKGKMIVPAEVKTAISKKYPEASKVTWEKEKGNYEANWGGKSGEENSVQFTPTGIFIEMVKAIPVTQLPSPILSYVKEHYKGAKITEAGRITNDTGKITYEAEVNGKDIIFDEKGIFLKVEA